MQVSILHRTTSSQSQSPPITPTSYNQPQLPLTSHNHPQLAKPTPITPIPPTNSHHQSKYFPTTYNHPQPASTTNNVFYSFYFYSKDFFDPILHNNPGCLNEKEHYICYFRSSTQAVRKIFVKSLHPRQKHIDTIKKYDCQMSQELSLNIIVRCQHQFIYRVW